jgi:antitoxin (DNA-binding transcriptional repressor) of toxin-antitoxin stability system
MKRMAAGFFKAHCLAVMDEVQAKHEIVVITKHGKPVAKLVPVNGDKDEVYGFLAGKGPLQATLFRPRSPRRNGASLSDSGRYACRPLVGVCGGARINLARSLSCEVQRIRGSSTGGL